MTDYVVAECMVRQLHARYVDAVWRKDIDSFGDCFAEDCEWRIAGHVLKGRAKITEFMSAVFPQFNRILLTMRTPVLEVGDGTASSRTYFTENSQFADGTPLAAIGSYYERFVDQGDRWRFSWRVFQTEYAGPPDFSGEFYDNPEWGAPPAMPPLDTIPLDHSGNLSEIDSGG
ncbi:MAG: nuclear transport factor 2 family protein [Novosphingobium sp.]|nr:nuclear transport factor 2 family protein [Novosphingobium sp.]MCP5402273.1 nuclear transport factor 2 family protein [Novosphingobium sp.]